MIATTNMHKVQELRQMLKSISSIDLRSLKDFPTYTPPEETGQTFEENAKIKATHAAMVLGRYVIADDSGIVVPALNGAPGIFSARFAGKNATDLDNRKKLLREASHLSEDDRYAYFECALALATPEGLKKIVKGTCEGMLTLHDTGRGGFGYDPIFMKHGYSKTFAELGDSIKHRISHRRKAVDKLLNTLESFILSIHEDTSSHSK